MNSVVLIGRLTKDVDLRYSNNQTAVGRFSLAVDRHDKDKNCDFISCIAFGKSAENLEKYVKKGNKVAINGRIQTGSYKNKEGRQVYTTDVVAERVEFIESKQNPQAPSGYFNENEEKLPN